jgi:CRP-like cAMP-binding protein
VSIIQGEGFNQIDELKITEILKGHFFFYNMMKSQRSAIISKMIPCRICKDQYVFKQGDPAGAFFIIDEGFVDIEINGVKSKILK